MSKLRAKHGNCTVVGCAEQHKTLHLPPASEERRAEWVRFIFDGDAPATVVKNLYVCANHFASDCFTNLGQYRAGLAKNLKLNEEAVPTVRDRAADRGNDPNSDVVNTVALTGTQQLTRQHHKQLHM